MGVNVYVVRGVSSADCQAKIVERYGIHFNIIREKTVSRSFFGLFPREEYEIEFYLTARATSVVKNEAEPMQAEVQQVLQQVRQVASGKAVGSENLVIPIDFQERKKNLIAAAGRDPDKMMREAQKAEEKEKEKEVETQTILEKLGKIEEQINSQNGRKNEHSGLTRLTELLKLNDFSESYIDGILKRVRGELPLDALDDFDKLQDCVLEWIGESIRIFPIVERPPRRPGDGHSARIMALVGPPGVGKTTTIAKLAAVYGVDFEEGKKPLSVRVINIDSFRIGAQDQLEGFTKIMELPSSFIENHRELQREIDIYREATDLIIVDTTGRSPKASAQLGEMKQVLDACGAKAEVHLTVSASTKTDDLLHIMRQFEPFNYSAVLVTKLDETLHVGSIISALAEKGKPVSYVADGQIVPRDVKKANAIQFLINLEEFRVDRETLKERFPESVQDRS